MAYTTFPKWDMKVTIVDDNTADQASSVITTPYAPLLRREQTFNGYFNSDPIEYERVMLDQDMYTSRHYADFGVISRPSTAIRKKKTAVGKHVEMERLNRFHEDFFLRDKYKVKTMQPALAATVLTEQVAKRFDRQHCGSITTRQFMRDADLDTMGRPNIFVNSSQTKSSAVSLKERTDIVHKAIIVRQNTTEFHPTTSEKSPAVSKSDGREGKDKEIEWMFPKLTVVVKSPMHDIRKHRIRGLLEKIKYQVLHQREYLKSYFQARDRVGLSHISVADMKAVMGRLYFPLSDGEKDSLCRVFDFNNNERFHYMAFMDLFVASSTICCNRL